MKRKYWYQVALDEGTIDYWNFNNFLRKNHHECYNLFCAKRKEILKRLYCVRIKKMKDGLWYGVTKPERG